MRKNISITFIVLAILAITGWSIWSRPSLDTMVGQMIMTGFHGDGDAHDADAFDRVLGQIRRGQIGGVILFDIDVAGLRERGLPTTDIFSSNIRTMPQVRAMTTRLQDAANGTLFIAVDQEGGAVQRLKPQHGFAPIPSAAEMNGPASEIYNTAYDLGSRLAELGINMNFAPVLDVNINRESPIIGKKGRAFSDNADTVADRGDAFAHGLGDAGIAYSFKHFPGHGSATTDSHHGITDITETWREEELIPYQKIIPLHRPGAMVMVGHIINRNIDDVPASLSRKTITMLRDMGFDGVVVSDDMNMGAIVNEYGPRDAVRRAIDAGNDLLVFGNNLIFDPDTGAKVHAMIIDMVRRGEISRKRIYDSYRRIQKLKKQIGLMR